MRCKIYYTDYIFLLFIIIYIIENRKEADKKDKNN